MKAWISSLVPTVATLAVIFLTSCGGGSSLPACIDNGDCGEGEACILEQCQPVDCLSSEACNVREYCDLETYVCRAGCSEDGDCEAGEKCDVESNTCETYGCRTTELDCAIGETCSAVTGECVRDSRGHCDRCTPDIWDPRGTCRNDSFCLSFEDRPDEGFCFHRCSDSDPCPRGFECAEIDDFDFDGRLDAVCFAYCPILWDNGWL